MNKALLAAPLLLAACAVPPAGMKRAIEARYNQDLAAVDIHAVAGAPGLHVAVCEAAGGWLGFLTCFRWDGGPRGFAGIDVLPAEQTMRFARSFVHPEFAGPLVEIVGQSSPGVDATAYLYEWRGRALALVGRGPAEEVPDYRALARDAKADRAPRAGVMTTSAPARQ